MIYIGTPLITQPTLIGQKVHETPTTITIEITALDFTPKTGKSGLLTHTFKAGEREHFKEVFIGQRRRFRKATGKQVGGGKFPFFLL